MEITPFATKLPECSPNLMPFHLAYSGPALISRYFRVRPAPAHSFDSDAPSASTSTNILSSAATVEDLAASAGEDSQVSLASTETMVVDEASAAAAGSLSSVQSTSTLVEAQMTQNGSTSMRTRVQGFVAAFRGRQVRGQTVELPQGYGGIVLQATKSGNGNGKAAEGRKTKESKTKGAQKPKSGRGGRTSRRSAREDAEEEELEEGNSDEPGEAAPVAEIRTLKPTSTFSSFVLWTPDIPVDEGKDEYFRSLTEWTALAAEIHRCEDLDTGA
ncbi:hypothetical protein BV22DRAFT_1194680 [Leucogyrophana mollusca]|uniref:Uncharacterized protein n=1 Tax=Leucogyrophana mollusca TaxID=85980 RepID=A0ACB8BKH3_9AGAM|nr:hypothetical protein BV22DRAFT_1194680 [Leucogyrophana mollusca]